MPWKPPTHAQLMRARQSRRTQDRAYEERRRRDPALALARCLRSSAQWKKVRAMKLARDPLCEECKQHAVATRATQVHHREALVRRPDLAFVLDNLVSTCTTCHARLEAEAPSALSSAFKVFCTEIGAAHTTTLNGRTVQC